MMYKKIGIIGDGQLAQMTCQAGQALGLTMSVYATDAQNPAALVADHVHLGQLNDMDAMIAFAKGVDVITYDTELLPIQAVRAMAKYAKAYPSPDILSIAQNRIRERAFLKEHAIPQPKVAPIEQARDLNEAIDQVGLPCVLKTAEQGYDGKGQAKITSYEQAQEAYIALGEVPCTLEAWVDYEREMSVIVAGDQRGSYTTFAVIDNEHQDHILYRSIAPSTLPDAVQQEAIKIALTIAKACQLVGLLTIEMFHTRDGRVLVNELAPRPHNSGHHTKLSARTSQFAQLCRAISGLPLGPTEQKPAVMINLLGDFFLSSKEKPYQQVGFTDDSDEESGVFFYGKKEARKGRKMGHVIATGVTREMASMRAEQRLRQLEERYRDDV
nr:5-(carboxyamino)imidazole ribonucleotide synthase [Bacilli bacterium]